MQVKLSAILIVLGMILAAGKIYADSEPGAIPLAMILGALSGRLLRGCDDGSMPRLSYNRRT